MGKLYKNQTKLRFQNTSGVDVSGATCKIKYLKPDGTEGEWTASILTAATGVIYYDVISTTELDQVGNWKLWSHITFTDGRVAEGEPIEFQIYKPGT